jgi:hypothetical protein
VVRDVYEADEASGEKEVVYEPACAAITVGDDTDGMHGADSEGDAESGSEGSDGAGVDSEMQWMCA